MLGRPIEQGQKRDQLRFEHPRCVATIVLRLRGNGNKPLFKRRKSIRPRKECADATDQFIGSASIDWQATGQRANPTRNLAGQAPRLHAV